MICERLPHSETKTVGFRVPKNFPLSGFELKRICEEFATIFERVTRPDGGQSYQEFTLLQPRIATAVDKLLAWAGQDGHETKEKIGDDDKE